jgi:peptidoglycan/xylan/chitin deacetylase (PgdA/CDA1 family)
VSPPSSKERLVGLLGRAMRTPLLAWTARSFFRRRVNVVFYHGVWRPGDARLRLFGGVDLDRFAADLRVLKRHFRVVGLERILREPPDDGDGRPLAAVTFDDGFDLTGGGATDAMDEMGIPATVFVNTACASYEAPTWQHRFSAIRALRGDEAYLHALNRVLERTGLPPVSRPDEQVRVTRAWPSTRKDEYAREVWEACDMPAAAELLAEHRPYLDWDGLRDWMRRGHGVGAHTRSHPFCSRLDPADFEPELVAPAGEIRSRLGLRDLPFAYPFGDRLPPDREAALAGRRVYTCLLGTWGLSLRPADPHRVERIEPEAGIDLELFGWPIARRLKGAVLGGPRESGPSRGYGG